MKINDFANELLETMNKQLADAEVSSREAIVRASNSIEIIKSHTYGLKNFLYQYEFSSPQEEIHFFKHIKPKFVSLLLFHNELFDIEVSKPLEKEAIAKHYLNSLQRGQTFINSNMELYKYYHFGSTYLDSKYFLSDRNHETGNDVIYDSRFCTPFDNKFCILRTCELLKDYLTKAIENLSKAPELVCTLQWTGSKISLIELIYALHAHGVYNKAASDVKMIASYFEKVFNVDLGNYYRTFKDIQMRKNGKTVFLDELREKLHERLGDGVIA